MPSLIRGAALGLFGSGPAHFVPLSSHFRPSARRVTRTHQRNPVNANTDTTDLHCGAPVGDVTITAVLRSAGLPLHVVDSSRVLVIRDSRITVLETGEVLEFSLARGIDRGRLVTCTFTETFPGLGDVAGEIGVQVAPGS